MIAKLVLLLVSVAFSLAALELGIRMNAVPAPGYIEGSSAWWKERWQRTKKHKNPKVFVKLDPDLGWIPAPGLVDEPYQGALLSTNSASLRGRREIDAAKRRPRIVVVGDSFTFGQCVNDAETFPERLQAELPSAEVLNLGVMGYAHDQMLVRLRRDGLPREPDVVLLGYHGTDVERNGLCFRDFGKPCFALEDGELVPKGGPIRSPEEYDRDLRFPNYVGMLRDTLNAEQREAEQDALAQAIIREMAATSRAAGAEFAMVTLPRIKDVQRGRAFGSWLSRGLCEAGEFPCISATARIRQALGDRDPEPHFECHYSAELQALIADEIADFLAARWPERVGLPPPAPVEPSEG